MAPARCSILRCAGSLPMCPRGTSFWGLPCAEGFVRELEGGLDAPLGERGAGLSEGQSQRLAVARAIFSGSPVLLLDEATSALDAATELQLLRNLRSLADRTVVVVTHRPVALELCDRAIEFDG